MQRFLGFWALLCVSGMAAVIPPEEVRAMESYAWKLPSELSLTRVQRLLNHFARENYGVGFRYLGEPEDFDHGHLLVEEVGTGDERKYFARAILYHTQENAHAARWDRTVDIRFDYIDARNRNWIQWLNDDAVLDGILVENARKYVDARKKSPDIFFSEDHPKENERYTIHSHFLDPEKIGFKVYGDLQFNFKAWNCDETIDSGLFDRGPIEVEIPAGVGSKCLKLSTHNGMRIFR